MNQQGFVIGETRQRGISLIIVMVMLLLGTIVVLSSTRISWLNEKLVGSESDYQRAFAAAEALMRDAERDVKGVQINNITPCNASANYVGCRNFAAGRPFFPQEDDDLDLLSARLTSGTNSCLQGICLPASTTTLGTTTWGTTTTLASMTAGTGTGAIAATYGLYTGASPAAAGNPLLSTPGNAWYWVEVFRYTDAAGIINAAGNLPIPDKKHPYVYRITTYVQGLKPGTRVWLRSVFVPYPQNQNS
jgi:type IV pilus assembly protein PilX